MSPLKMLCGLTLAGVLGLGAPAAHATTLFTFSDGQPTGLQTGGKFNIGNAIQVGASSLSVTDIGAYVGPDQAAGVSNVAFLANIYTGDDNATLLSSTPIPIGTPVDAQGFAYVPFSTTLAAATPYWITDVAVDSNGNAVNTPFAYNLSQGSAGTWTGATLNINVYNDNPSPATERPDAINNSFQEFLGANLKFVPEPSGVFFGLGAAGLATLRRRRNA